MGFWAGLELVERCYCPEGVLTIQRGAAAKLENRPAVVENGLFGAA